MPEPLAAPHWHPLSMLPIITRSIEGEFESLEELFSSLLAAREKPYVLTERLKRIQGMAERYNKLGVVKDETVAAIDAAVAARTIPAVRTMTGSQIKEVRTRYNMSQAALAMTTGMSVESVSKWERNESRPNKAALRIINIIDAKGPQVFMA